MLEEFGPSLYIAEGPTVSFYGFPYPTRMAVAQLSDGGLWVWSPVALTDELVSSIEAIGPVLHIVSPNKIHHLFLQEWLERWPDACVYASPGLARRKPEVHFDADLTDEPEPAWAASIDQVIFRGSLAMEEVVFFHKESCTTIVCDLIQRHAQEKMSGWKGKLMQLDGLVGVNGSTPREWRASFLSRRPARAARQKVLGWQPDRLLIAHGECVQNGATEIIKRALSWI
ncbi:MAG: DUF4336 domain-containing protein [bacterium]|nr:DUF4336 domain-containing protein [Gammaproteobacteria bacterium]HIL98628.1 DUF4336 domain-containing protein [Pseudomonadales bacterium]